ncbi:MAG: YdgA family protein [Desulfobacterales bacterium]|nr:YdgA family protein [Desulfobacterales bacterium]
MKKIIIGVGLIIIFAGAGTPLFSGLMMERIVKQSFIDINRMYAATGSGVSVEISQYDRRFSSSQIEWKIKLGPLKSLSGVEEIIFINRADHGVTNVVSTTSLEKNKWFTDFVNHKLNGKNPLEIRTEYKFSGDIKSTLALDAFSFKEGGDTIEMRPGTMLITLDKGVENIFSEITWEGCFIPGKIRMDNLSFNSKIKKISTYIWDGKLSFAVENIKMDNGKERIELSKLKCAHTLDYNKEDASLSIGMGYGIDSIKSGQNNINNAFVRIGLNRIDARGYEDFMRLYSQMMNETMVEVATSQHHPDTMKKAVEKQMTAVGLQMVGTYEKLLKKGFEIQISDLRAQLPQGKIKGDITLSLKKDMTIARFVPIMMQPAAALEIFLLKSDVTLPFKLVGDNQMLLAPVYSGMQTGLFIKDGDNLIHKAETRDGKLLLNGKEVLLN